MVTVEKFLLIIVAWECSRIWKMSNYFFISRALNPAWNQWKLNRGFHFTPMTDRVFHRVWNSACMLCHKRWRYWSVTSINFVGGLLARDACNPNMMFRRLKRVRGNQKREINFRWKLIFECLLLKGKPCPDVLMLFTGTWEVWAPRGCSAGVAGCLDGV